METSNCSLPACRWISTRAHLHLQQKAKLEFSLHFWLLCINWAHFSSAWSAIVLTNSITKRDFLFQQGEILLRASAENPEWVLIHMRQKSSYADRCGRQKLYKYWNRALMWIAHLCFFSTFIKIAHNASVVFIHSEIHMLFLFHVIPKSLLLSFRKCNSKSSIKQLSEFSTKRRKIQVAPYQGSPYQPFREGKGRVCAWIVWIMALNFYILSKKIDIKASRML